jgi:hypothetical protein
MLLVALGNQCEIILNCVDIIIDSRPETNLIKKTLVFPGAERGRDRSAANSWVNNDYTDTRGGIALA